MNLFSFVHHLDINFVEERVESVAGRLRLEMTAVHGAQKKGPQTTLAAEFEKVPRVRQFRDEMLRGAKTLVEPGLDPLRRRRGEKAPVEPVERQAELGLKLRPGQGPQARLGENVIRRRK